jgi:hypothetical protein
MFFVFTGAGLMKNGAGYRGGNRLQQRGYGSEDGSTQHASKLGTTINQQLTEKKTLTFTNSFIGKLLYHIKKVFPFLDLLAPEDGEDIHLPENLKVEMGMHLLEEEEGETEMDTAPEGAVITVPTTGPAADETAATATAAQSAAAAANAATTAAAAAAAKLRASQALSDKLIERAAKEAAEKKNGRQQERKRQMSCRGSDDSSEFGSFSSTNNSDMPPL